MGVEKKIDEIHDEIQSSYYISQDDVEVGEETYNYAILGCLLGYVTRYNVLLTGNPGWGKTTVPEGLGAMVNGIPPKVSTHCKLNGHPFQTEEKIKGRPDLAKLNIGEKGETQWANAVNLGSFGHVLVDEINGLHEGQQVMVLEMIDRGVIDYLDDIYFYEEKPPFFATQNYTDEEGSSPLAHRLTDRFDISLEVVPPVNEYLFLMDGSKDKKKKFDNPKLEKEFLTNIKKMNSPEDEYAKEIYENIIPKYKTYLEEQGIPVLYEEDLRKVREGNIPIDEEAMFMFYFLDSGVNSHIRVPDEYETEHYEDTPFGKVKNNLSHRFAEKTPEIAKAIAVLSGKDKVDVEAMETALIYTLPHRLKFKDEYINKNLKSDHFPGSQQLYSTSKWIQDVKEYFNEHKDVYKQYVSDKIKGEDTKQNENYDIPQVKCGIYKENFRHLKGEL